MKAKTQQKLNLKHIKIRLSSNDVLQKDILEKVVKQGRRQGLQHSEFIKFSNELFETHKTKYLMLTKRIFDMVIK
jgi:hypothetical protein